MSRKKTEKRNLPRIGIFTDKSATYNLAILETLYKLNAATTWQIAKAIQEKQRKGIMSKGDIEVKSRHIYSVIQRKTGRLQDLEAKGYITHSEEGLWQLTVKATWALQMWKGDLIEKEDKEAECRKFVETVKKIPDGLLTSPLGISVDRSVFKNQSIKIADLVTKNPSLSTLFFEEMKQLLIEQGLDLDYLSVETLLGILTYRKRMKPELEKLMRSL